MSGGTWDYNEWRIQSVTEEIANPEYSTAPTDFPTLIPIIQQLGNTLYDIIHQLDWHYACDTTIDDFQSFEHSAIHRLHRCLNPQSQDLQPSRRAD